MKSPITGEEMKLVLESRELTYRKEKFSYIAQLWLCEQSGEMFTSEEMDEVNIGQVYNQYRVRYGIPFADEIRDIRSTYGLSATKMSEILGFGENQYRLYENGEMPSEANGKLIKSIMNPDVFLVFVKNSENQFEGKAFHKILEKVESAKARIEDMNRDSIIYSSYTRSLNNGYAAQSYSKLKNILLYLIDQCGGVFNTKMNKLLFFIDFLSYKKRGVAMSGLAYKAIQYGPVPNRYDIIYGLVDDVRSEIIAFPSGYSGTKLYSEIKPDLTALSQEEINIMDTVISKLKPLSANEVSEISHKERAWKEFFGVNSYIDFNTAFDLITF